MKNRFSRLASLMALAGVLTAVPLLGAADQEAPQPGAAKAGRPDGGAKARGERAQALAKELNLTDEQKTKVQDILKTEADKIRALRDDTSLTQEQRREKMRALRDEVAPKMKGILTAEQFEKWQKIRAERRGPGGAGKNAPKNP